MSYDVAMDNTQEHFVVMTANKVDGFHNHLAEGRPAAVRVVEGSMLKGQALDNFDKKCVRDFLEATDVCKSMSLYDREGHLIARVEPIRVG